MGTEGAGVTEAEVNAWLDKIRGLAAVPDLEMAHSEEDDLREAVLTSIAAGHPDPAVLAALALKTNDIEFFRMYGG